MVCVLFPLYCQGFAIWKQVVMKTEDASFGAIRDYPCDEYCDAQWLTKDESSAMGALFSRQ